MLIATPQKLIVMFQNPQFGEMFPLVLGVNNSGHLSHTRYVDHQFTGHQFALCHAIHAGDQLDDHQFQATLAIILFIVFIALLILSIIDHSIQSSIKKEKRPLATRIINNEQFSGCLMQPHYFVIINK